MARKRETSKSATIEVCTPEWKDLLARMILIRRFEEASEREFRKGRIGGYLHVYSGQEGVVCGVLPVLGRDDVVFAGYRDHAHALLLGSDPGAVMAELFGRRTGVSSGKGGSMHLCDAEHGLYGGYGIVGGHLTLAAGAAYALRYRGTDGIAACFFGDGAMNIGSFHEAMNMAGLWGKSGMCPALFVIENNGYAMGTSVERHSALTDLSARVRAYNMRTERIDGQDVLAIRALAESMIAEIRETGRPACIEAVTYRYSGHGAADVAQPYRSKEEVEQHRSRDPIALLTEKLQTECGLTDDDLERMTLEAEAVVAKAVEFAESSPAPDPGDLYDDVIGGEEGARG